MEDMAREQMIEKAWQRLVTKCAMIDEDPDLVVAATAFNVGNEEASAMAVDLITSAMSPEGEKTLRIIREFEAQFRNDAVRRLFDDFSVAMLANIEGFGLPTYAFLTRNMVLVELLSVTETKLSNDIMLSELIRDPRVSEDLVNAFTVSMAPPGAWVETTPETVYDDVLRRIEELGGDPDDYDIRFATDYRFVDDDGDES